MYYHIGPKFQLICNFWVYTPCLSLLETFWLFFYVTKYNFFSKFLIIGLKMLTFALLNVDRTQPDSCLSPSPQGASPSPQGVSPSPSPQGMSPSPSPRSMSPSPSPASARTGLDHWVRVQVRTCSNTAFVNACFIVSCCCIGHCAWYLCQHDKSIIQKLFHQTNEFTRNIFYTNIMYLSLLLT